MHNYIVEDDFNHQEGEEERNSLIERIGESSEMNVEAVEISEASTVVNL